MKDLHCLISPVPMSIYFSGFFFLPLIFFMSVSVVRKSCDWTRFFFQWLDDVQSHFWGFTSVWTWEENEVPRSVYIPLEVQWVTSMEFLTLFLIFEVPRDFEWGWSHLVLGAVYINSKRQYLPHKAWSLNSTETKGKSQSRNEIRKVIHLRVAKFELAS